MAVVMAETEESYYSPERIDGWLRQWELLAALAESRSTSAHYLTPEHRHSQGACGSGRPVGIKDLRGRRSDSLAYADILADIDRARQSLAYNSLGRLCVNYRIRRMGLLRWRDPSTHAWRQEQSGQLDAVAFALHVRYQDALHAYRDALKAMAAYLGYARA